MRSAAVRRPADGALAGTGTRAKRSGPSRRAIPRRRFESIGTVSRAGTWYGAMWSLVIGMNVFLLSSPLVFEPLFTESLRRASTCTTIALVLSVPRLRVPRVPVSVVVLLAFGLASSLWSVNAGFTVHFAGLYVVLSALAVLVACNVDTRALSHGLVLGAVIVVVLSVYAYWQHLPGSDVLPGSSGFLAGVGTNRNILAYTMIIALAFAVSYVPRRPALRIAWLVATVVILGGIVLAESVTGIVASAALVAVALGLGARDRHAERGRLPGRRSWMLLGGTLLSVGAVSVAWYESLHRELARDLSLSGRVDIWQAAWAASSTKTRLVGDGWGAVWPHPWRPSPPNGAFDEIVRHIGHSVTHGHNSAADLIPEIGLVGVALFCVVYGRIVLSAVRLRRRTTSPGDREAGRVGILGVLGLVLAGVTEPITTIPLGFFVAVLLLAHLGTGRGVATSD